MTDLLANPIWHSLSTRHSDLANGNHLAKRCPEDIGPLSGIPEQSTECWEALKAIVPPADHCVLFLDKPADTGGRLKLVTQFPIEQMLCESPKTVSSTDVEIEELGENHVHEMMSLAALTEPGPFRRLTIQLGGYVGIRVGGHLAAMSGQRTAIPGYREVSAVCTHPSYRGRGYAATLVCAVMDQIAKHGDLPYLHVRQDNISAIRLYRHLGFRITRTLHCTIVTISEGEVCAADSRG
jgi:ribosomal protein S18 acetylase RimI-like enzyme